MKEKRMSTKELLYHIGEKNREFQEIINQKKRTLIQAPSGKIHVINSKNRVQYYLKSEENNKPEQYISKTNKRKIQIYLQKRYDEKISKFLERGSKVIEKYFSELTQLDLQIKKVFSDYPDEVKSMVIPVDCSDEEYRKKWEEQNYNGKSISDEIPIYISDKGERVRSKSELNIANALYKKGIPYKYEAPIKLKNNNIIYPDFTVLNTRKREVYYWEHRGMMDDREYARHAVNRVKEYQKSGIALGLNLLITEETLQSPLSSLEINQIIDSYFM